MRRAAAGICRLVGAAVLVGCTCASEGTEGEAPAPSTSVASSAQAAAELPKVLFLPGDAGAVSARSLPSAGRAVVLGGRCPPEMVDVGGRFCIDRYEAVLEDGESGRRLSPYYHPTVGQTRASYERWLSLAPTMGPVVARRMAVPPPPPFQLEGPIEPVVRSIRGELPSGYLSRPVAAKACRRAGKRLCTSEEWTLACRGYRGQQFPYGTSYAHGRCNVFRDTHPAALLHGDASEGHLDPRLNLAREGDAPLLRPTGDTPECRSEWGADAIYDMVGNLDEWVSDAGGVFVGGFYARATRSGCDARVEAHPPDYFDYSLGVRCCR